MSIDGQYIFIYTRNESYNIDLNKISMNQDKDKLLELYGGEFKQLNDGKFSLHDIYIYERPRGTIEENVFEHLKADYIFGSYDGAEWSIFREPEVFCKKCNFEKLKNNNKNYICI